MHLGPRHLAQDGFLARSAVQNQRSAQFVTHTACEQSIVFERPLLGGPASKRRSQDEAALRQPAFGPARRQGEIGDTIGGAGGGDDLQIAVDDVRGGGQYRVGEQTAASFSRACETCGP